MDNYNWRDWTTNGELWEKLKPMAREMRHEPTPAESKLWGCLRGRRVQSAKFRRQHPIERFIVDFFCSEAKLVIEVDGKIHQYTLIEDTIRQEFLESLGLQVIRFTNHDILHNVESALLKIEAVLNETMKSTGSPSPNSERGSGGEVE